MMTGNWEPQAAPEGPPEEFVELVKDALENLYDFPYLQNHPLAREVPASGDRPGVSEGQRLRHELVAAVETLNPGPHVSFNAPTARLYNLLLLHYVEGVTIQEAAHELGVSRRQAHRDLRRGHESVASLLWSRRPASPGTRARAFRLSSIEAEMARLETHPRPTDIRLLLEGVRQAVEPLARQQGVSFQVDLPENPVTLSVDLLVARQVLVNLLSYAIGQAEPGPLFLTLTENEQQQVSLALGYTPQPRAAETPTLDPVVARLAERLDWRVKQEDRQGTRAIVLDMSPRGSTILIIDDNEGLVELLSDYLSNQACRVITSTSGQEGLRLAQELLPDAILLDVMIPEMDGWELLQRLRHRPQTAGIPVIICSVLNNPELAYSLGASLFIPKPVNRNDVLTALRQVGAV